MIMNMDIDRVISSNELMCNIDRITMSNKLIQREKVGKQKVSLNEREVI